jgi:hypothetical protein
MVTKPEFEILSVPFSPDDIYDLPLMIDTPQVAHLLSKDRHLLRQMHEWLI